MDVRIFIGDVDEFYCDAVSGDDRRWAVWKSDRDSQRFVETLLGRFDTEDEAVTFAQNYDVGPGKNKIVI